MTKHLRITHLLSALAVLVLAVSVTSLAGQQPPQADDGPRYTAAGQLVRPADYRDWVFASSGLGMTYGPAAAPGAAPMFDNVFVTRAAYREFLNSGTWPDGTMLILEIRRAEENVSINNGGRTQGAVVAIEAAVKDRKRFPDNGWAYFNFGGGTRLVESAAPLPATQSCYACHRTNAAVENTFVQFYPALFEAATRLKTVRSDYDPARKP